MCRIVLFIAQDEGVKLDYFLRQAPNSLIRLANGEPYLPGIKPYKQIYSRNPKENLDGYGIYFIDLNGDLICKKSKFPIIDITTQRLHHRLTPYIDKGVQYLHSFVRNNNFKKRNPNKYSDVQPYKYKNLLFTHNGGFNTEYSKYTDKIGKYIDPVFLKKMQKINIDSKWLFGLFASKVNFDGTYEEIVESVEEVLSIMYRIKDSGFNISLNVVMSDLSNDTHLALRYRTCNQLPPALYYNKTHPLGYMVASEPLDHEPGWKFMRNHLIIIRKFNFYSCKLKPEIINCE